MSNIGKPPIVLNLVLPQVHALPGATRYPRIRTAPGLLAIDFINAGLTALLLPEEVVFTEDSPVVASLGSTK